MNLRLRISLLMCALFVSCANHLSFGQKELTTVVIDPGHGGKDSGALGKKCKEKDIVLDIALRLGKMINDSLPEVKTLYTRDSDVFIPLIDRSAIANKNGADLFISIHANSVKNAKIQGSETFVLGLHRSKENLEVAQKENSVITLEDDYTNKYEGFDPTQPESYIIFELMQNLYLEQSILMASMVQDCFAKCNRGNRGVKQAGFVVLRQSSMPSILVEVGFLSNAEEELYLISEKGKKEMTESIFQAFKIYKMQFNSNNKVSMKLNKEEEDEKLQKGIRFQIQIATSSKPLENVTQNHGKVDVLEEDGKYKYMIYRTSSYDEAAQTLKKVKKDFTDCFIVAFEDGKKVTVRYARKKSE